jgi:hypothetical protein
LKLGNMAHAATIDAGTADAQNHTAHIPLVGDYTHSTSGLSSDGTGGTLVIDPLKAGFNFAPASASQSPASAPALTAARLGSDGFVLEQPAAAGNVHEFSREIFREQVQAASPLEISRSDADLALHQVDLVHATGSIAALAELHDFILR